MKTSLPLWSCNKYVSRLVIPEFWTSTEPRLIPRASESDRRMRPFWRALIRHYSGGHTIKAGFQNKVSFRYDETGIRRGYLQRYIKDPPSMPRVSLGGSVQATRFHFADDSVREHLERQLGVENWLDEMKRIVDATTRITRALGPILRNFVNRRGTG